MSERFVLAVRRLPRLVVAMLALSSVSSGAQTAPAAPPPPACADAAHRQFDFWIGTWDVYLPDGQKAGENRIEPIAGGCALLEHWSGRGGVTGKSLNIYDRDDRQWHQTWVDNSGGLLMIAGGLVERRMVMTTVAAPGAPAGADRQRIAWSPGDDGSVRQVWESSSDGGATWKLLFDGKYVRRP
jgi:hypothetical protein